MSKKTQTFVIDKEGNVLTIYDDSLTEFTEQGGTITTKRASHVEPADVFGDGGLWTADLSPVGGPALGPFRTRKEALDAELKWLDQNLAEIKIPK